VSQIEMSTGMSRRALLATVLAVVVGSVTLDSAQGSNEWAIDQAQRAVREQIAGDEGNVAVRFAGDARTESPSNTDRRVRGSGSAVRDRDGKSRPFSYLAVVDTRTSNVSDVRYDWHGDWRTEAIDRLTRDGRLDRDRRGDGRRAGNLTGVFCAACGESRGE
jgi:hypothetical protein